MAIPFHEGDTLSPDRQNTAPKQPALEDRSRAAAVAVADLAMVIKDLGGTEEQAAGFREAVRLGLLDRPQDARSVLKKNGFDEATIEYLMPEIVRK